MTKRGLETKSYYRRLTSYPSSRGNINQLDVILNKIARDPITRRAIATTRVPEIDLYLDDSNYLEEVQLRAYPEGASLVLNMYTRWGNCDDGHEDEMIELHDRAMQELQKKSGIRVIKGSYFEECLGERNKSTEIVNSKIVSQYNEGETIPEVYWKALNSVEKLGFPLRTQYDRKDNDGEFIDPPGKDLRVVNRIFNPFEEPRYPILSFCERGAYIAEFLGAKDHLVIPYAELLEKINRGEEFEATQWPYCYHGRFAAYPTVSGTLDQLEIILDKISEDISTKNAIASTRVPEIDLFMKEDQPCLGQIQLLAEENDFGIIVLNMIARWRSRDLYKAWGDNLIGITNLFSALARRLSDKTERRVVTGWYAEDNGSLHFYGQDYNGKGLDTFFERFPNVDSFVDRAWTSDKAKDLVLEELKMLKTDFTWRFPPESIKLIGDLIEGYESEMFKP